MSRADKAPRSRGAAEAFPSPVAPQSFGLTAPFDAAAHARTGHKLGNYALDETPLQRKEAPSGETESEEALGGLPDSLTSGIENLSGYSMEDVRVNYNSAQPAQLGALAYARGNDIHIDPGQEKHLPHEAWHVAQQSESEQSESEGQE